MIGSALAAVGKALSKESLGVTKVMEAASRAASSPVRAGRAVDWTAQLERLYRTEPIEFASRSGDSFNSRFLRTGFFRTGNSLEHVVVRAITTDSGAARQARELAASAIHAESPFTNHFPITVARHGEKLLVQERVGRSIDASMALIDRRFYGHLPPPIPPPAPHPCDRFNGMLDWRRAMSQYRDSSPAFRDLLERSAGFRDQMEQSVAERLILGDRDGHKGNFTLLLRDGCIKVANIDMQMAFEAGSIPVPPRLVEFADKAISAPTQSKVDAFTRKFDSDWGRSYLAGLGLGDAQVAGVLARSEWLLKTKRFPG